MIVKTSKPGFDWGEYPKLAAIFEHRPRHNAYWMELEKMFEEWLTQRGKETNVLKLVDEANEIMKQKRCMASNDGKHPPVWHEGEILWRCGDCGKVLES